MWQLNGILKLISVLRIFDFLWYRHPVVSINRYLFYHQSKHNTLSIQSFVCWKYKTCCVCSKYTKCYVCSKYTKRYVCSKYTKRYVCSQYTECCVCSKYI